MKKSTISLFAVIMMVFTGINNPSFAVTHTVQVGNYYFNPVSLNVEVGDIVKWVWVAGVHTTTSSTIPAGAAAWDEIINSGHQTYSYTVAEAGTYNYVCTPHIGMGMTGSFTASAPAPVLSVMPPSQSVNALSGMVEFSVASNTDWTATSDAPWCAVTSSGSGNGSLTAIYSENSTYAERTANITVTVSGLPPVTVTVVQDASTVGTGDNDPASICLYPNPVKDFLKISLDKAYQNGSVSLIDLTGKPVMEVKLSGSRELTMNISTLSKGCYFVRIETGEGTVVRRILIS